ncbi:LysR family transcriptional regulator [Burkholderia pseudomultivorans]|uniref:Transcriptional regulator n=2 Tax=Burkholderia cepacia complex TaxID=87882 RepID=A0A132F3U7_9BURK|nr:MULTISPECIES: LysR family transcriptional regulator [Burkholderia cepacia complex]AOI91938.1 transcriptional regulator [Burkholderia pseudomultivorans]KVC22461.1 transcriptional regulator [Burkholderia pseudomultivorans]KVC37648.1 transcriptional regulator [Burkholderia pseudomultivorans]KVC55339.1 transcriptional regulator [Burkholderia pseudomultivorans]KVG61955.1 transcriptional regulator [Burkholderia pseudomultivorans]
MDRLRAMEFFLSISRNKSFSETARQFGIAPASVSRMVLDLENDLKVKLFTRTTRCVTLTEAGIEYAKHVEGILRSIDDAHRSISSITSAPSGTLRVHSRVMFGLGVLPTLITEFSKLYPSIQIELTLSEAPSDLNKDQIDIDFRIAPPIESGIKRRILFRSERHLVVSPGYFIGRSSVTAPEELKNHQCIAYSMPGSGYSWRFRKDGAETEVHFQPRHVTNNGIALLEFARMGEGIVLLDDYTVHKDLISGKLVRLLPEYQVTNSSFEDGMYATIIDSPAIPTKIRLFLDFVASRVSGPELRFSAYESP